jgi:YfiH family protein
VSTLTVDVLRAAVLEKAGFVHAFPTRSLDFKPGEGRAAAVLALARAAGFDAARLSQVSQVHGARVVVAPVDSREEADALVALRGGDVVGVRVADCVPVLVGDEASGAAAAIHAGWRGVVGGVIAATLAALGARRAVTLSAASAAIGPCIGACCFEVGSEVAEKVGFVDRRAGGKAYVDLRRAVRAQLVAAGIDDARIEDVPGCTRCDAERLFSFRRGDEGRHLCVIASRA